MKTLHISITEAALKKHKHSRVILRDKQLPFLSFRYSKNSKTLKGSFHLSFSRNGITTSKIVGRYPMMEINPAKMEASKAYLTIQKSRLSVMKASTFETCGELLKWYLEFRLLAPGSSIKTLKNISHQVDNILLPVLAVHDVESLNHRVLAEGWLNPSYERYSVSTLKNGFQCLKAAYNQADKLGYLSSNPLIKISFNELTSSRVKPKRCKIQSLNCSVLVRQIRRFDPGMRMMCFLCLGYMTRNRETAVARWDHFDFTNMIWHIPAENTKTGQSISHPITQSMLKLLMKYRVWQRHRTRSSFLFPRTKGYKAISESQAASKLALLTDKQFSLHDLRKYGSSQLRDMGVDYYIVERILNHKMTQLDETYIHTSSSGIIRQALSGWHEKLKLSDLC